MLLSLSSLFAQPKPTPSRVYAFVNGQWFDGQTFKRKTLYSANGLLTTVEPSHVDSTIDLQNKFVVPPFGEAHNHNVESSRIDAVIKNYLEAGIFYVKNPNSLPRSVAPTLSKINLPTSIDVAFSGGGLTSSGGHPWGLVLRNIERKIWTDADAEEGFLFTIDTLSDLDAKWRQFRTQKSDFVKTYLLYSEEYAKRKEDSTYFNWRGLDPVLLPNIVERAHHEGLSVSTHVESAYDFHVAITSGVDEVNHMPGFRPEDENLQSYSDLSRYKISEDDAALAARNKTRVVTTLGSLIQMIGTIDSVSPIYPIIQQVKDLFVQNLRLLHKYGVRIAIGSDKYSGTSQFEALHLHSLQAFDNKTLLKMWCENTPLTIFPNRKIGYLRDGYEASFLLLTGNPLSDFNNITKIDLRVKQGEILALPNQP